MNSLAISSSNPPPPPPPPGYNPKTDNISSSSSSSSSSSDSEDDVTQSQGHLPPNYNLQKRPITQKEKKSKKKPRLTDRPTFKGPDHPRMTGSSVRGDNSNHHRQLQQDRDHDLSDMAVYRYVLGVTMADHSRRLKPCQYYNDGRGACHLGTSHENPDKESRDYRSFVHCCHKCFYDLSLISFHHKHNCPIDDLRPRH